jgi:diguanylate cyclase (GGDEF)-like protein
MADPTPRMGHSDDAGARSTAVAAALPDLLDHLQGAWSIKGAADGRYRQGNAAMGALAGRPPEQLAGASDEELFGPAVAAALRDDMQAALAHGGAVRSEHRFDIAGAKREFAIVHAVLAASGGDRPEVCSIWLETTAAQAREAQLQQALVQIEQHQAAAEALLRESAEQGPRDRITGLYQGAQFEDLLRREVDLSSREHREFALAAIELDPYSDAVRACGAEGEQRVLESLGRLLRGNTRAMDASCRLDDRRFAVLLSGVGLATAHSRMEGMRRQCATQIVVQGGRELGFTVSMGVASFPHTAHSQEELMQAAGSALAEARRRGGNHVTLASIRFAAG